MKDTLAAQLAPHKNKFPSADADAFMPPTFSNADGGLDIFGAGAISDAVKSLSGKLLGGSSGVATADCGARPTKPIIDIKGSYQKEYEDWSKCNDTAQKIKLQQSATDAALAQAAINKGNDTGMSTGAKIAIGVGSVLILTTVVVIIIKTRK